MLQTNKFKAKIILNFQRINIKFKNNISNFNSIFYFIFKKINKFNIKVKYLAILVIWIFTYILFNILYFIAGFIFKNFINSKYLIIWYFCHNDNYFWKLIFIHLSFLILDRYPYHSSWLYDYIYLIYSKANPDWLYDYIYLIYCKANPVCN
jgi:hypothetical protein